MAMLDIQSVSPSGRTAVDSLLVGAKWDGSTISYSFRTSAPDDSDFSAGFAPLNATQRSVIREALARWASVCQLTFVETVDDASNGGVIRCGTCSSNVVPTSAAYYPNSAESGGDVWFGNSNSSAPSNPQRGNYAYNTFVHELGHALGLKHPHSIVGLFPAASADQDAMQNSIMSYRSYVGDSTSGGYGNGSNSYAYGPMGYDIAAVQYLYGANYSYNADDTWYRFDSARATLFATVWDGGGIDTYDLSAYSSPVCADLRPGAWTTSAASQLAQLNYYEVAYGYNSVMEYAPGNVCNALLYNDDPRSLIENAIGGSGADTLIGNQAGNLLRGGGGRDTLTLGGGADTVVIARGDGADYITDISPVDNDLIYFERVPTAELKVQATDTQFSVSILNSADSATWTRNGANFRVVTGADSSLLYLADVSGFGAMIRSDCLFYAGTSANASDCVQADMESGVAKYDLADASRYYSVEFFDDRENSGGNVIRGTTADNVMYAATGAGNSTIGDQMWGRSGDDLLVAGNGSDTLWYGWNEGFDTISGASSADVIRLYNVAGSMVRYSLDNGDLLVTMSGTTDVLRVSGWAMNRAKVTVADELTPFTPLTMPTTGDTLTSGSSDGKVLLDLMAYPALNHIDNRANANSRGSVLRGNSGGNMLRAADVGAGQTGDQLWGRVGNDTLFGGSGSDTFWFGKDEGEDVIATPVTADTDKIMLYTALTPSDVSLSAAGANLVVAVGSGRLMITDGLGLLGDMSGVFRMQTGAAYNLGFEDGRYILK